MRELHTSPPRGPAVRGHRVLSGTLALLLVMMLAATAVFAAPAAVGAQTATATTSGAGAATPATAALAPDTALVYISATLDPSSPQVAKSEALLDRAGLNALSQSTEQSVAKSAGASGANAQDIAPFLGGELGIVVTNLGSTSTAAIEASGMAKSSVVKTSGLGGLAGGLTNMLPSATPAVGAAQSALSGAVLIDKPSHPTLAWAEAQKLLQQQASSSGAQVTRTTYGGVTIQSVAGTSSSSSGAAIAKINDFIIVSGTPADLEPVIDASSGKVGSLAKLAAFSTVQKELRSDYLAFGFVNGPKFAGQMGSQSMAGLGLTGMSTSLDAYSGFVVWADDPGFRIDTITVPAVAATGSAATPAAQHPQATLAGKVPAGTMIFADGYNLGKGTALNELALALAESVVGETNATPVAGQSQGQLASAIFQRAAQSFGFNLQTDFVQQLVGEYGLAIGIEASNPTAPTVLLVSGVSDQAKLNDALSKLSLLVQAGGQGSVNVTTKQVSGSTINVVTGSASGLPIQIEYGVVNGQLIIGYGNSLETYVAGYSSTLADNAQYKAVMATLPADHSSTVYVDVAAISSLAGGLMGALSGVESSVTGSPAAGATATTSSTAAMMSALSGIKAYAVVGYVKDGMQAYSAILYIPPTS